MKGPVTLPVRITAMPDRVSRSLPDAQTARAIPKSSSTAPCGEMTTFSGFTSR